MLVVALAVTGLTACAGSAHESRSAGSICTYYAAPRGSDYARGTRRHPFRTFQRLADALRPGTTGCLLAGTYVDNPDIRKGGTASEPATIRSYPGQVAQLDGTIWVQSSAPYVRIEHMKLCGSPGPPACSGQSFSSGQATGIDISADHTTLSQDDISNPGGICVLLGTATVENGRNGPGDSSLVTHNRIHFCGGAPGSSNLIEGIYDQYSSDTTIVHNLIYHNAAMGIQFYPGAQRTTFDYNTLWDNGEGVAFGGSGGVTSNNNVVEYNSISDSVGRWNIESFWPQGVGTGNVAAHNCLHADNPNQDGYYDLDDGVEPAGQGGIGFRSFSEGCTASEAKSR
jgi:Right handed beta helix region